MGSREAWQHLLEMSYLDASYPSAGQSGHHQQSGGPSPADGQSLDESFLSAISEPASVSSLLINLVDLSFVELDRLLASSITVVAPAPTSVRSEFVAKDEDGKIGHTRSYKLSDYWPQSPDLWFGQTEAFFAYYGENLSCDRFQRVLLALPESVLKTVLDIVANPPETGAYECLK